jgi:phage-related minor tail protein
MADAFDSAGNDIDPVEQAADLTKAVDELRIRTDTLTTSANGFANAMSRAFLQATLGGKQLDEVFRSLALRISSLAVSQALRPITSGIAGGLNSLFSGLFGKSFDANGNALTAAMGAIKPFAAGGVIGTPTFFPLSSGGLGLAGEAGPEAIIPLSRRPDGRLGVAAQGAGATHVTIQIFTPDADSFRRSEAYVTGQIARAVARGQRSL